MNPALRTAATGMAAQQTRTEVIANNLANVNTTAFKRSRAHFEDLLYQTVQGSAVLGGQDATTTPAIQVGRGTRLGAVERLEAQGALEQTGRQLDVAIDGEGFFQVQLANGQTAYTRDGSFDISDQGMLVTKEGHAVSPGLRIPDGIAEVSIARNGIVSGIKPGGEQVEIGRIETARFTNPAGLLAQGENLYTETTASGQPIVGFPDDEGMGRLIQGHLESSNVEIVQEMVDMIAAQRAYELNSKAIKAADEMSELASNIVR
jgi:flagellar basal-body rod protein FlgG